MKKCCAAFFLMTIVLLAAHIHVGTALEKTFEWNITSSPIGYTRYKISLTTSDSWQIDTKVDVTFRLTLTAKNFAHDYTETEWVRIVLSSESFTMNSGNLEETANITDIGDFWEQKASFHIQAEKVNRGQTLNVSINFIAVINEFDSIYHQSQEYTEENVYDPMIVSISRPLLSTLEVVIVAALIAAVAGIGGYLIYRRRRRTRKTTASRHGATFRLARAMYSAYLRQNLAVVKPMFNRSANSVQDTQAYIEQLRTQL